MKKKFGQLVLSLALLAMTLTPAMATNWIRIGNGHYLDADSIRPSSNYGTYTMLTKYIASGAPLEVINGREVWTIKTNTFIDCPANYGKTVSYSAYSRNNRLIASSRNIGKQWFDINLPNSRGYEAYTFVCTDRYINHWRGYDAFWAY